MSLIFQRNKNVVEGSGGGISTPVEFQKNLQSRYIRCTYVQRVGNFLDVGESLLLVLITGTMSSLSNASPPLPPFHLSSSQADAPSSLSVDGVKCRLSPSLQHAPSPPELSHTNDLRSDLGGIKRRGSIITCCSIFPRLGGGWGEQRLVFSRYDVEHRSSVAKKQVMIAVIRIVSQRFPSPAKINLPSPIL